MNDMTVNNPFGNEAPQRDSSGSRQLQARENSEVLALIASAKRFPRDVLKCADKIQNAFTRVTLAEKAQYQFARGGSDIVGPSIRAAEAMAQAWTNMSSGWREMSRTVGHDGVGVSEVEAYCVDYENTTRESIQFVVRHWRDTRQGGYALKDERDIYELLANQAARRKRACVLAQIPGDVVEMAMDQVAVTLRASADTSPEAIARLVTTFAELGITREQIEKRIQRKIESIQPAQIVGLKRVYASLRDDMSSPADWFDVEPDAPPAAGLAAVRAAAAEKRGKKAPAKPAPEPAKATKATAPAPAPAEPAKGADDPSAGAPEGIARKALISRIALLERTREKEDALVIVDEVRDEATPSQIADLMAVIMRRWPE